jgi:thioredoxin reductase
MSSPACNETRNPLETSRRGIFAIGDVRSGSIKRRRSRRRGRQVVATLHATLVSMESDRVNSLRSVTDGQA